MIGVWIALGIVALLLVLWAVRPVLGMMGLGYALQSKRQAALIMAGLMVATTVIAAAGITADSAGASFTESLLGRLELTDVILDGTGYRSIAPSNDVLGFAQDPRVPDGAFMSPGYRAELAFESAASGLGDNDMPVWGVDPTSHGAIASWDAIEGFAPASLDTWEVGTAVVNAAAARDYGIVVGDPVHVYVIGEEVLVAQQTPYDGHFELTRTQTLPPSGQGPEHASVHHPDDVYQFTYETLSTFYRGPTVYEVVGPSDVEFQIQVTDPAGTVTRSSFHAGRANVTFYDDAPRWLQGAEYDVEVLALEAQDVDFQVTVTELVERVLEGAARDVTVVGVIDQPGSDPLWGGPVIFLPLPEVQALMQAPDRVNIALVDFPDETDLRPMTDAMQAAASDAFGSSVFVRNDRARMEEQRDEITSAVRVTFLGIGSFSIIAGFMLIGVMMALLVEERKRLLAASRAVGAQRRDLTVMHGHEGSIYSVLAGVAGLLAAVLLAAGLSGPMDALFQEEGGRFVLDFQIATVLGAVGAGFALTMVAIVLSAHFASRFHIAAALKGEEQETRASKVSGLVIGMLLSLLGGTWVLFGLPDNPWAMVLGMTLLGGGLMWVFSRIVGRNTAYAAGAALLAAYLASTFSWLDVSDQDLAFLLYPIRGVLLAITLGMVAAYATWLHAGVVWVAQRFGAAGAYVETALAHLRQRPGRTSLTIVMFSTVLVILTALGTLFATFEPNDLGDTGGFEVLGDSRQSFDPLQFLLDTPPRSGVDPGDFTSRMVATGWVGYGTGALHHIIEYDDGGEARRVYVSPTANMWGALANDMVGLTDEAIEAWRFAQADPGRYPDLTGAMRAVQQDPGKVILGEQLSFYLDRDGTNERHVEIGDVFAVGFGDDAPRVEVIAVVDNMGAVGGFAHPQTLQLIAEGRGMPAPGTRIWADPAAGVRGDDVAAALESAYRRAGIEAVTADNVDPDAAAVGSAFQTLISVFLGLGILIGMVALALIMGRNVLLRRAEIGSLRAMGAQPTAILAMFSFEALYVSLFSIVIGFSAGILLAWATVTTDAIFVPLQIDWQALGILYGITILAAMAAAFLPAWRASRIPPAQAVRYTE